MRKAAWLVVQPRLVVQIDILCYCVVCRTESKTIYLIYTGESVNELRTLHVHHVPK